MAEAIDGTSLAARIAELETRVAFQEHALSELSDALADARMEVARNSDQLMRALGDLKQVRTLLYDADPGSEPPPPHY